VIQEAAHEDANIIFGAVVDPALKGKVKITVIATGFDRKTSGRAVPATTLQTPVDLHSYTAHLSRAAAPVEAEPAPVQAAVDTPAAGNAPQFGINRRASLDLALPLAPAEPAGDFDLSREIGPAEAPSQLDVPAFLRRQN
jgi:cell division protein FtsZ